jgi:hypothetical protein
MITNENDFLALIISCTDEKYDCKAIDVVRKSGMRDIDCLPFFKSLETKGLIKMTSTNKIHVYPQGYEVNKVQSNKIKNLIDKASKFTPKSIKDIIVATIAGIIAGIVTAFIIYHLGW